MTEQKLVWIEEEINGLKESGLFINLLVHGES